MDFLFGFFGAIVASVVVGVLIGLFATFDVTAVFILGLVYFPAYLVATVIAFAQRRDWVGFGMLVAILLAWPAFTLACIAAGSQSIN